MRTLKPILIVVVLMCCLSVSAQYDGDYYSGQHVIVGNEPTISYKTSSSYSYDNEDWGNVYVEYSPMKLSTNKSGYDDLNFKGFTIGFSYAYMLGDSPVFLESGVETSGFYFSENYYDESDRVKHSYEFYWAKIPVNIGLRYNVSEDFALVPYGGVNLTVNISAEERYKYGNGVKESYNLFDEDYMGDDGYKRFRIGWQGGLRFIVFNTVSIGASYKSDLTPFYSDFGIKQKFGGFSFGIGYCF